jgi:hypothetical protein
MRQIVGVHTRDDRRLRRAYAGVQRIDEVARPVDQMKAGVTPNEAPRDGA